MLQDLVDVGVQVDDGVVFFEIFVIFGMQDGVVVGGQYDVGLGCELVDDFGFVVMEVFFVFDFEDYWDGGIGLCFDFVV